MMLNHGCPGSPFSSICNLLNWLGHVPTCIIFQSRLLNCHKVSMDVEVSWNRDTPKSSISRLDFPYVPTILGYPYLWKPPCIMLADLAFTDRVFRQGSTTPAVMFGEWIPRSGSNTRNQSTSQLISRVARISCMFTLKLNWSTKPVCMCTMNLYPLNRSK